MKNKVLFISLVLAVVASLAFASCAPEAAPTPEVAVPEAEVAAPEEEQFEWKMVIAYPETNVPCQLCGALLEDKVERESNGRLKITVYCAGELMKVMDTLDACSKGVIQMEESVGAYWRGIDPVFDLDWALPMSCRDQMEGFALLDYGLQDVLAEAMAERNLYYLSPMAYNHWVVMTNKPIHTLSDFEGLKVRGTGPMLDLLEMLGAMPVFLAGEEIFTGLQLGTIDAAGWSSEAWETMKWGEVCKYYTMPHLGQCMAHISVNMDAWNSLPDDLKYILKSAVTVYSYYVVQTDIAMERMLEASIPPERITTLSDEDVEELKKISIQVWDKIAKKSPRCAEGVEIMKEYLRKSGAIE